MKKVTVKNIVGSDFNFPMREHIRCSGIDPLVDGQDVFYLTGDEVFEMVSTSHELPDVVGKNSTWVGEIQHDNEKKEKVYLDVSDLGYVGGPTFSISSQYVYNRRIDEKKAYSKRAGEISKNLDIPFDVALAIGKNANLLKGFTPPKPTEKQHWELTQCGIDRRKDSIREIIGDTLFEDFKISKMGQKNSTRVAHWLAQEGKR